MKANDNKIRKQAEQKIQELIEGRIDPDTVSQWAQLTYSEDTNSNIIDASKSLSLLFDYLATSAFRHGKGQPRMYDVSSYREWYDEYMRMRATND